MVCRLILAACVAAALVTCALAQEEQTYELKEQYEKGEVATADSRHELSIEIKRTGDKIERNLPVKSKQVMKYVDKVLEVDDKGFPSKVARHYEKSTMELETPTGAPRKATTPFEGNTYIIEKTKEGISAKQLGGKEVTEKQEKELAAALAGNRRKLLPGKKVKEGDTWEVPLEAVREIYSIDQKIKGTAKATFSGTEQFGEYKCAVVKLGTDIEVSQGPMTMKYKGQGKILFALEKKKIVSMECLALVEVSGSQKTSSGEVKFGGGGNCRTSYRAAPGKGTIDLTPPKKEEEKKDTDK